ncbi:MAG: phage tail family protein [Oscillospiraceae bacterium]|nr:phage tail family protein [Oscillospiraceae bacterium]
MNFLDITLECNGQALMFGKSQSGEKREFGITKITGLESAELEISTSDNALVDGSTVDGKRIKNRIIHIEATLRDDRNNAANRQRIIKFFNPKYTGKLTVNHSGVTRNIAYELEGWNFVASDNVYNQLSIVVDLKCPDPFLKNIDNFGRNMADISKQFAFPWRVVKHKVIVPAPYKGLTLPGQITGYRTLTKEVFLPNDGDVPTGVQIQFIAKRGPCLNPKITLTGTGQFFRVKVAMQKGDVLLVDTNERHQVVELNGVNTYQKIDRLSEPFSLATGSNYLEYDADENYSNLDVRLFYTPLYLGV